MIKFFRRIRQRLLSENLPTGQAGKFSKYLIYAIGEIVLVVIGILIALGINNWNQGRQNKKLTNLYINNFIIEIFNYLFLKNIHFIEKNIHFIDIF